MTKLNAIQLFEDKKVRTNCDSNQEKWFVFIIDVIEVLTDIITQSHGQEKPLKNIKF